MTYNRKHRLVSSETFKIYYIYYIYARTLGG